MKGGGAMKNNIVWELPKKGGFEQFANLRGAWQESGGWCFWGGVDIPMHTMKPLSLGANYYQRNCVLLI